MKKQNRLLSLILSLFLLLFTLVPQSALTVKAEGNSEMAVHFIDVGQGNAILVQSGGQNLLYDGGDQSHADLIISYLQEQNVENIDYMIASHYDEDHIGGLVPCIDNFSVSNIFGPDYVHTSNLFNNFMNTATANAIIVQYPSVGETFDFGTGSFTVLAPNGISQNSNDNSLVTKLENGSNTRRALLLYSEQITRETNFKKRLMAAIKDMEIGKHKLEAILHKHKFLNSFQFSLVVNSTNTLDGLYLLKKQIQI